MTDRLASDLGPLGEEVSLARGGRPVARGRSRRPRGLPPRRHPGGDPRAAGGRAAGPADDVPGSGGGGDGGPRRPEPLRHGARQDRGAGCCAFPPGGSASSCARGPTSSRSCSGSSSSGCAASPPGSPARTAGPSPIPSPASTTWASSASGSGSRSTARGRPAIPSPSAIFDLDHFKTYNDTRGHEEGNEVLRAVGDILRGTGRRGDVPARYGGEEFVTLLYGAQPRRGGGLRQPRAGGAGRARVRRGRRPMPRGG